MFTLPIDQLAAAANLLKMQQSLLFTDLFLIPAFSHTFIHKLNIYI